MSQKQFIQEQILRGQQAIEKVEKEFQGLTREQFNWKHSQKVWSIAECIQHLIMADRSYFEIFESISNKTYQMSTWQRYSPLSSLLGNALRKQMTENPTKKTVTHKKITPTFSSYDINLLDDYKSTLNHLLKLFSECQEQPIDKIIITSPLISWITYSRVFVA